MNVMQSMSRTAAGTNGDGRGKFRLRQVIVLAGRELRSGLNGFYVFIACVALGVMVITAVGALSDSLRAGLEAQGEQILGGDIVFARSHTRATAAERAFFEGEGRLSETATMRATARRLDGSEQALIELKAIDGAYPLSGSVKLQEGPSLEEALSRPLTAVAEPILLQRLGLKVGDKLRIGNADLVITQEITKEPDGLADRLTYGSRVMVSLDSLAATGMVQPGTLVRWRYALKLAGADGANPAALQRVRGAFAQVLPEAGFTIADRRDPSPQLRRTVERLRQFLTLIGLTALLVGGVGVANAVATFIDRRRKVIATFKSLGATNGMVLAVFLTQVLVMASIGVALGVTVGLTVPALVQQLAGDALPIRIGSSVTLYSIGLATLYGVLVAAMFALWPLGRAELVSPAILFRDEVSGESGWPSRRIIIATVAIGLALVGVAMATSDSQRIALLFLVTLGAILAVFLGLGEGIMRLARRLPRPAVPELALAIGNVARSGGLTRSVVLSLGAGLSLLVAVALADVSIVDELKAKIPEQSPNYFVLDVAKDELDGLSTLVKGQQPKADIESAPMLRGRLVRIKDQPTDTMKVAAEAQWVLSGDRGLTYAENVPAGSRVVEGAWWPAGYDGPPLVSFEADLAKKLGIGVGDEVTVNVLGRNVSARVANLRELNWESLAINFVMVFSPNTLKGAPHNLLATITLPRDASLAAEADVARAIGRTYPGMTAIRVKDALNAFAAVYGKVMVAVRVAAGVTLAAGALVLAGALATAQRRRVLEAVILKTLGATRRRILAAHMAEYLGLAACTAVIGVALGALAAWLALTRVMEVTYRFSWLAVGEALGVAVGLVAVFGAVGTWRVLSAPAVPYLRSE